VETVRSTKFRIKKDWNGGGVKKAPSFYQLRNKPLPPALVNLEKRVVDLLSQRWKGGKGSDKGEAEGIEKRGEKGEKGAGKPAPAFKSSRSCVEAKGEPSKIKYGTIMEGVGPVKKSVHRSQGEKNC